MDKDADAILRAIIVGLYRHGTINPAALDEICHAAESSGDAGAAFIARLLDDLGMDQRTFEPKPSEGA